jgi:hypothetical protein
MDEKDKQTGQTFRIENLVRKFGVWYQLLSIPFILLIAIFATKLGGNPASDGKMVRTVIWGTAALMILLTVVSALRTKKPLRNQNDKPNTVNVDADEVVQIVACGILRVDPHLRNVAILDRGNVHSPENTLLLTDKALYMVYVPIGGGDNVLLGIDLGMAEFYLANKELKAAVQSMLESDSLTKIVNRSPANRRIELSNIKQLSFHDNGNIVELISEEEKFKYTLRDQEEYSTLKSYAKANLQNIAISA